MQQTNNCEQCCLARNRGYSHSMVAVLRSSTVNHEIQRWTDVKNPIGATLVNSIHMARITLL